MAQQPTATSAADAPEPLTDTGDLALDAKLAALDDDLQPIDGAPDPFKQPAKTAQDDDEDNEDEDEPDEQVEDAEDDNDEDTEEETEQEQETDQKASEEEDEGYILDEADKPADNPDKPVALEPEEQYILNGIKDSAITVRGVVGDSTEIKEYKVLMPEQLPIGFKYVDDREQSIANKAYTLIEQEARRLQADYQQRQNTTSSNDLVARENMTERQDASSLQKNGDIPPFKKNPEMPYGFDSSNYRNVINLLADNKDEAAVLIKEVLDFKDKLNDRYMREYNAGRSYKHVGFDEAFQMYRKANATAANPEQIKEDKARHRMAKRTGGTNGSQTDRIKRPRVKQSMTSRELDDYIESLDI